MAKDPLITRQSYRKYQKKKREKALAEAKQEAGQSSKQAQQKPQAREEKPRKKAQPSSQTNKRPQTKAKAKAAQSSDRGKSWHWRQGQAAQQLDDSTTEEVEPRPIDDYLNWGIGLSLLGIVIVTLIALFV
ncbi:MULTISPECIES: hypothetical protein [Aerococcus]|uniref:Uncharacterized protein n=1 Tax=Aerococcus sanguinicola TaxID=119206 RepID=A0A5N1GIU1_9LACT|nr:MULTISPECIES: hypothetical protein [Aerococcus]KAA9300885.1 hypothetical protein F6I03_06155 [Aerococcus sanguinicola]MDK6369117.1 hypothetical protein [Aerococcus sp. UMB9870]MDK6679824.1 hypothetical protein [Aerococcus sp. UMB8608]MDK6686610.1 hypothetical protein [Aerococcus sp. UMB8623]MDK6939746.1 hypothetical protein [Aerococcus sp. UMB8487]